MDDAQLTKLADDFAADARNKYWDSKTTLVILRLLAKGMGAADVLKMLNADKVKTKLNEIVPATKGENKDLYNAIYQNINTTLRGKVTGKTKAKASTATTSTPLRVVRSVDPVESFLSAFMTKDVPEEVEDETIQRDEIAYEINEMRRSVLVKQAKANAIIDACEKALRRLDELRALNVSGEGGRPVAAMRKLLADPNSKVERLHDKREDQEVLAAHDLPDAKGGKSGKAAKAHA